MSKISTYREGVPCWVDYSGPDVAKAQQFYQGLFGWDYTDTGEEGGGYQLATLKGLRVAGIGPRPADQPGPPVWTTYLCADSADQVTQKVRQAGGQVLMEPLDVMDQGRMAVAADTAGAVFGLWQGRTHGGSGLANEPGSFTWNENLSTDPAAARAFYQEVFGYEYEAVPDAPIDYSLFKVQGNTAGAISAQPAKVPAGTPSRWTVFFSVSDTDQAVAKAMELGGGVVVPPRTTPYGRFAVLHDDSGAHFCVISAPKG